MGDGLLSCAFLEALPGISPRNGTAARRSGRRYFRPQFSKKACESSDPVKTRAKSAAYNSLQRRGVRDLIRQFPDFRLQRGSS
jgi:hypothetical protein